ncbi:hypothetical protein ACFLQ8_03440, partial [Candidatus Auribacterota bacterium]
MKTSSVLRKCISVLICVSFICSAPGGLPLAAAAQADEAGKATLSSCLAPKTDSEKIAKEARAGLTVLIGGQLHTVIKGSGDHGHEEIAEVIAELPDFRQIGTSEDSVRFTTDVNGNPIEIEINPKEIRAFISEKTGKLGFAFIPVTIDGHTILYAYRDRDEVNAEDWNRVLGIFNPEEELIIDKNENLSLEFYTLPAGYVSPSVEELAGQMQADPETAKILKMGGFRAMTLAVLIAMATSVVPACDDDDTYGDLVTRAIPTPSPSPTPSPPVQPPIATPQEIQTAINSDMSIYAGTQFPGVARYSDYYIQAWDKVIIGSTVQKPGYPGRYGEILVYDVNTKEVKLVPGVTVNIHRNSSFLPRYKTDDNGTVLVQLQNKYPETGFNAYEGGYVKVNVEDATVAEQNDQLVVTAFDEVTGDVTTDAAVVVTPVTQGEMETIVNDPANAGVYTEHAGLPRNVEHFLQDTNSGKVVIVTSVKTDDEWNKGAEILIYDPESNELKMAYGLTLQINDDTDFLVMGFSSDGKIVRLAKTNKLYDADDLYGGDLLIDMVNESIFDQDENRVSEFLPSPGDIEDIDLQQIVEDNQAVFAGTAYPGITRTVRRAMESKDGVNVFIGVSQNDPGSGTWFSEGLVYNKEDKKLYLVDGVTVTMNQYGTLVPRQSAGDDVFFATEYGSMYDGGYLIVNAAGVPAAIKVPEGFRALQLNLTIKDQDNKSSAAGAVRYNKPVSAIDIEPLVIRHAKTPTGQVGTTAPADMSTADVRAALFNDDSRPLFEFLGFDYESNKYKIDDYAGKGEWLVVSFRHKSPEKPRDHFVAIIKPRVDGIVHLFMKRIDGVWTGTPDLYNDIQISDDEEQVFMRIRARKPTSELPANTEVGYLRLFLTHWPNFSDPMDEDRGDQSIWTFDPATKQIRQVDVSRTEPPTLLEPPAMIQPMLREQLIDSLKYMLDFIAPGNVRYLYGSKAGARLTLMELNEMPWRVKAPRLKAEAGLGEDYIAKVGMILRLCEALDIDINAENLRVLLKKAESKSADSMVGVETLAGPEYTAPRFKRLSSRAASGQKEPASAIGEEPLVIRHVRTQTGQVGTKAPEDMSTADIRAALFNDHSRPLFEALGFDYESNKYKIDDHSAKG